MKRAFRKATRDPKAGEQLDTVLASETKQQYLEGVVRICAAYPDELKTWFHGKRVDWVRAALVPRTSHIPGIYLSYARRETNIIEASHAEDNNAAGRKQSLLGAILGYILRYPPAYAAHMLTNNLGFDLTAAIRMENAKLP